MDIEKTIRQMAQDAKTAAGIISRSTTDQKNRALLSMASLLEKQAQAIFKENRKDLERAEAAGLSAAMVDRLAVSESTLWPPLASAMISGLIASTLLTLVVLPAAYRLVFARKKSSHRFAVRRWLSQATAGML